MRVHLFWSLRSFHMPSHTIHVSISVCVCVCARAHTLGRFSGVWLFATPWTAARQAPLSMRVLQARTLGWVAMPSSRGSSWPRNRTWSLTLRRLVFTTRFNTYWEQGKVAWKWSVSRTVTQEPICISNRDIPYTLQFLVSLTLPSQFQDKGTHGTQKLQGTWIPPKI